MNDELRIENTRSAAADEGCTSRTFRTRSLQIKALGTALEVVEVVKVDVLEDDAIFHLRPEGPSLPAISVVA